MNQKYYTTITGIGHYHPETVLPNQFFDDLGIGSEAGWIKERTGIEQRRICISESDVKALNDGSRTYQDLFKEGAVKTLAELSGPAWNMAIERMQRCIGRQFEKSEIEFAICGTSTPDWDLPANACSIAANLQLSCPSIDVNSACSAFIVDLHMMRSLMLSGDIKLGAVFNPERLGTRLDFTDRTSCILFGDAASATIIEKQTAPRGLVMIDSMIQSDPSGYEHVRLPEGGTFAQNGRAVQKFAVTKTVDITRQILERNKINVQDVQYFIAHQANLRMLKSAAEKLGFSEEQHLHNVAQFGNQGCTGASATLSQNWDRLKDGDTVVISVVGAGLTWASGLFHYHAAL